MKVLQQLLPWPVPVAFNAFRITTSWVCTKLQVNIAMVVRDCQYFSMKKRGVGGGGWGELVAVSKQGILKLI